MRLFLSLVMVLAMLSGCLAAPRESAGSAEQAAKKVKLTFMTNIVGEDVVVLEAAVNDFSRLTGYEVEFEAPGKSYEELMKTKMSSKKMPDLFTTHGWSIKRYGDYLEFVNERPFTRHISPRIKPFITDTDGNVYVLPIDQDVAGIVYNLDVVESVGVNVDDIRTWDDFAAACAAIKRGGYTPIHVGAKDDWPAGQLFDWIALSFYITNDNDNKRNELFSGIFDPGLWDEIARLVETWYMNGYFNEDALTADYASDIDALAQKRAAFGFYNCSAIVSAKTINPNARLGLMPIPSKDDRDDPILIMGERMAVGVWKDSPYKQEAFELLDYLASPEVAGKISAASGNPSGLTNVSNDIGDIAFYYEKYRNVRAFPYFDREYLPSGMWDLMIETGLDILSGKPNAARNAGKLMEQNFNDKFTGNKN